MTENIDTETGEVMENVVETNADLQSLRVGLNLLKALVDELKMIKDPSNPDRSVWHSLKEDELDTIINRFTNRIQYEVRIGYSAILAGGLPSAVASLEKVVFSDKGIEGKLLIPRHTDHRHDLADFAGSEVVVVMADDISEYFENMSDIVAPPDQLPLMADEPETENENGSE